MVQNNPEQKDEKDLHMYLDDNRCYFVCSERLGLIESAISRMAYTQGKRKRAVEFNGIAHTLKALKVVDTMSEIVGISFGCLSTGEAGMFVLCKPVVKIQGSIPQPQPEAKT